MDKLCEINVIEQVMNARQTTFMQDAWRRGQTISIHGWICQIADGIFQDLQVTLNGLKYSNHLALKIIERQKGE